MAHRRPLKYPVPQPDLQVSFYYRLQSIRGLLLQEALAAALARVPLAQVDAQLSDLVRQEALKKVASFGLRGEVFFPVPCLMADSPHLLGYYRLLLGLSQKEFYSRTPYSKFKKLEEVGELTTATRAELPAMCGGLVRGMEILVERIDALSVGVVKELQTLTLGAQWRGSENTRLGRKATMEFYALLKAIVAPAIMEATRRTILVKNASGRPVMIEFASDPDVRITEQLPSGTRPLVSIEVKGGTDFSNIHNRLGEAEKSHQKAKARGFFEFWTILRVDMDLAAARRESPTTSYVFHLDRIREARSPEARRFREMVCSIIGIKT